MPWLTIAIMVGLAVINAGVSYYKSRKAEKDLEKNLPDFSDGAVPRVTESDPIPVIFGTPALNAPNVVWWKDQGPWQYREGEWYSRVRVLMVLCQGPVEYFQMFVDGFPLKDLGNVERFDLTAGPILDPGSVFYAQDKPFLLGYNAFLPGLPDQVAPAHLVDNMDMGPRPGYRGVFSIWGLIHFQTNLKPFEYWVTRIGIRSNGEAQWQPGLAQIGTYEMNPAHIIREIYTDTQWGLGNPESTVDETSFLAAANQFYSEGLGLSIVVAQPAPYWQLIEEIGRHTSSAIYEEQTTGKLVLKPIRDDYDIATIPVLGPDNVLGSPTVTRPQAFELANAVEVEYYDREARRRRTVVARDTASEVLRGTITDRVSYPFVQSAGLANQLATQELIQRSSPLANVRITVDPTVGKDLRAGDVVLIEYPDKGIDRVVLRITDQIDPSIHDPDAGIIIEGVEDAFAFESGQSSIPPDIDLNPPLNPSAPTQVAFELPLWLLYREIAPFGSVGNYLALEGGVVAMTASTSDAANFEWELETESPVLPRRMADGGLDFSPQIQVILDPADIDIGSSAINYTGGSVVFKLSGEGIEEPLTGEWLLIYLPDVADDFGAFPQIAAIEVTDWSNQLGTLHIGLFDTTTPVLFADEPTGVVLGYIRWSSEPTIRRLYGVDRHLYPKGETIDLEGFTRTLAKVLPDEDAVTSQVTTVSRGLLPYSPGNMAIDSSNDNATGYVDVTYSQRFRGGAQRLQTDTQNQVETGWNMVVDVYETTSPYTSFTLLGQATILGQQSARYTREDEYRDRGIEEPADALLFVAALDAPEDSLYPNTILYIRS